MGTVFDSTIVRQRLQRLRRDGELQEEQRFGRCDCTSYSYFVLSVVLFSVGTVITVLALGSSDDYVLSNLGHMWLVGPIFICSGMMVAVKSMLYLRRKSVIQMLLHQRAIMQEIAHGAEHNYNIQVPASASVDPPAYDALIPCEIPRTSHADPSEPPPPTYDEAMYLIDEKRISIMGKDIPKQDSSHGHISLEHRKP